MKKQVMGFLFLVCFAVLTGCSSPVQFSGKSEHWSAASSINPSANEKSYDIRYIGDDKEQLQQVNYMFSGSKNFHNSGTTQPSSNRLKISGASTLDTPYAEEECMLLIMEWNGKKETITLVKN